MAQRKSFEEKSKGMHKSRKLIIDTVFGRTDDNQKTFGYEKEAEVKRQEGEVWIDAAGKEWEQKNGFKINKTQMDDVRQYLQKLSTCSAEDCKTVKYDRVDKKTIVKTGYCLDCLQKLELELKTDGTYPFYEDYKISLNQLAYIRDLKAQYEEAYDGVKNQIEMINEDGSISKWDWPIDVNEVKADLQKDIDGAYDAIEALLERKLALENKLRELNHPELIKN
jgi:hypothetical protein